MAGTRTPDILCFLLSCWTAWRTHKQRNQGCCLESCSRGRQRRLCACFCPRERSLVGTGSVTENLPGREAHLKPHWVIGDSSFCDARTYRGQPGFDLNIYLYSLNCAVISSLGEDTEAGFGIENWKLLQCYVTLVYLIFLSCRKTQNKVTKTGNLPT